MKLLSIKRLTLEHDFKCCFTGIWVLHPSYVDDSVAKGALQDEEEYEWTEERWRKWLPIEPFDAWDEACVSACMYALSVL